MRQVNVWKKIKQVGISQDKNKYENKAWTKLKKQ